MAAGPVAKKESGLATISDHRVIAQDRTEVTFDSFQRCGSVAAPGVGPYFWDRFGRRSTPLPLAQ